MSDFEDIPEPRSRGYYIQYREHHKWWRRLLLLPRGKVEQRRIEAYDVKDAAAMAREVYGWDVLSIVPDFRDKCRECGALCFPVAVVGPQGEAGSLRICGHCLKNPDAPAAVPLGEEPR